MKHLDILRYVYICYFEGILHIEKYIGEKLGINSEFWLSSVALLGHVVSSEGIQVDPKKIETVQSWPRPSSAIEIRIFLGLVGYYRWFV